MISRWARTIKIIGNLESSGTSENDEHRYRDGLRDLGRNLKEPSQVCRKLGVSKIFEIDGIAVIVNARRRFGG